ncbi:hypothetical protein CPB86DRAFT_751108 [Serendipita vermifera]|nr:hypothetical protein CPB86DRAFT_751108 [Serendipita vermifera]
MKLRKLIFAAATIFISSIKFTQASALTTAIGPGARLCFYAEVDKPKEKIGFYFAVQSGGSFDINFDVKDPRDVIILDGERERQGDYILTANHVGEYAFCFENDMSTLTEKLVDFDIMVESEPRKETPGKPSQLSEHTSALEESIFKLRGMLDNIERSQKYFHTRENRGFSIVKSTHDRIFWYSFLECLGIVGMACAQVYILQTFFNQTGRKYKV